MKTHPAMLRAILHMLPPGKGAVMRIIAIIGIAVFIGGCATRPQVATAPPAPLICKSGSDCDSKWSRAVSWVTRNSSYKIQTQTDSIVQTMGPLPSDPSPAYTVTKVAIDNGNYEITFGGGCDNIFGCIPTVAGSRAQFAEFVNGGALSFDPSKVVWMRKDGERITGNPKLETLIETDKAACLAIQNQSPDMFKDCMASKGYLLIPKDKAEQRLAAAAAARAAKKKQAKP